MSDDSLLSQLDALIAADTDGLLDIPDEPRPITELDRLVRAFNEVNDFYAEHGREPSADTLDIAERKLGARLVGIRSSSSKIAELKEHDTHGLLATKETPTSLDDLLTGGTFDLLADPTGLLDVSTLPARKSPHDEGERAVRIKAKDFTAFADLFKAKHEALAEGTWALGKFSGEHNIREGRFFLINGQLCFVAEVKDINQAQGEVKPRLRVIFENGTESSMYRESLATRLYETNGQAVIRTSISADEIGDADEETGYIYVLKSLSDDPEIRTLDNLYKIGFSRGPVEKRIAGAEKSPTYLKAPVKVVATYRLYNMRPSALEHLIHRVFASVRLDASVVTKVGGTAQATEWFLAPLEAINRAIDLIGSGDIVDYVYSREIGDLVRLK
ncbi:GIY-YIG nuclease family protein [Corynebacterium hindlerae]|uniref:GIY-YIG nuclease family protein n=1 Tax=Corynebacterium hindlerae TaxID=699041 RepID=UPI001AD6D997|nr:GIY-YIG nuclease family protein [Corynebacterium hindlerae]QTH60267.1 GIY-YIG nuclease family protein [Corynebacterium hindlerae]